MSRVSWNSKGRAASSQSATHWLRKLSRVEGHTYPLAANFTASLAMVLAEEKPQKLGLIRLLRPEEYASTSRVARMEPYDPNKAVVLVIHGLMDTPATWVPMLNDLRGDPEMRRNYQFWFYSYPSGYAYPYSALILRQELDAIEKKYPLQQEDGGDRTQHGWMHQPEPSSPILVTNSGWTPLESPRNKQRCRPESKRLLEEAIIFKPRPEIGRVIFMSTPHRGSDLAKNWIGRIGSMLVRAPTKAASRSARSRCRA